MQTIKMKMLWGTLPKLQSILFYRAASLNIADGRTPETLMTATLWGLKRSECDSNENDTFSIIELH